ncbi:hypothetical protein RJ640_004278 [Escallonia rubra]|uniref:Reverse transcriptase Ty1/copia-type domain-containing protein n=1 Tax=Escallonia rubra TaxID=112253 RepID=A0AA88QX52_9ASTE|nr:hypothetical protein RJ640_004278 [Escallonia rubra]
MAQKFEMMDIGLMSYYLGIKVKQRGDGIFISRERCAKEILKKFKIDDSNPVSIPLECGVKSSKKNVCEKVNPTLFKSLLGSLRSDQQKKRKMRKGFSFKTYDHGRWPGREKKRKGTRDTNHVAET